MDRDHPVGVVAERERDLRLAGGERHGRSPWCPYQRQEVAAGLADGAELVARPATAGPALEVGGDRRQQHAIGARHPYVRFAEERGESLAALEPRVVLVRGDRRLPQLHGREHADDAGAVGLVVGGRRGGLGEQGVDGHGPEDRVPAQPGQHRVHELVRYVPRGGIGEGDRAGEARLLARYHRERGEQVCGAERGSFVALEEVLDPRVGREDRHRLIEVAGRAREQRGARRGELPVVRLERAAVDHQPGPHRRLECVE